MELVDRKGRLVRGQLVCLELNVYIACVTKQKFLEASLRRCKCIPAGKALMLVLQAWPITTIRPEAKSFVGGSA